MPNTSWLQEELIEAFNRLIAKQTGIVIREQDRALFCEKIHLRTKANQAISPTNYYHFLEENTVENYQEWEKLVALLTNNESYFFRDKEQLNLLKNHILPDLIHRKQNQKTIRICSAGCSTGQEPYTIAIILKELLHNFQHLILCRNVFIYFDNSAIAKVLDKIYRTLQPSGYFLTGHTELSAQNLSQFDKIVFPESIIYQRPSERRIQTEIIEKKPAIAFPIKPIINDKKTPEVTFKKISESTLNTNKITRSNPPQTTSLQPSISEILIEIETLFSQEKYDLAIAQIDKALKIDSNNIKIHSLLAQIYANLGQYAKAIQTCQQALKIDSFAISFYYLLAKIAEEQGNLEEAKRILKQIIYLESNSVSAYLDLSHVYEQEGDRQRANKMRESALNILRQLPPDTKIKERENIRAIELLAELERK